MDFLSHLKITTYLQNLPNKPTSKVMSAKVPDMLDQLNCLVWSKLRYNCAHQSTAKMETQVGYSVAKTRQPSKDWALRLNLKGFGKNTGVFNCHLAYSGPNDWLKKRVSLLMIPQIKRMKKTKPAPKTKKLWNEIKAPHQMSALAKYKGCCDIE